MRLPAFIILTLLSLGYAGLTVAETFMYQSWERTVAEQKDVQTKIVYFQNLNAFTEQVLRRMAAESPHDPAIAELLRQRKIKVVIAPSAPGAAATPETSPAQTPPTPAHP